MSDTPPFNRGDVVRWKSVLEGVEYFYGLVLNCEDISEIGYMHYSYGSDDKSAEADYRRFRARKITLFSFYEQKVIIVNQSEQDVPSFPELVFPSLT
tara:strand:- start:1226 stop:1516 length:291 start_codon:yes stop_codon:yes gene_type:complete